MTAASIEQIVDDLSFFDDWEDRYRYLIDLGRELPGIPESDKNAAEHRAWVQ